MLSCHVRLGAATCHTVPAAVTLSAVGRAISAEARAILFGASKMVVLRAILGELTAALVPTIARALDATIAADQTVIAVLAAIGLVLSRSRSRLMLNAAVATDQSVVSICATIWLIGWTRSRNVVVPPAVRAEIPIGVVSTIRTVVSVSARMVAVVVGVVPSVVVDVGVVVVNDRGRTSTAATSPVHSPGVPSPP